MNTQPVTVSTYTGQELPYVPTQSELRAALSKVLQEDMEAGHPMPMPSRISTIIREAFDRANQGEFQ